VAYRQPVTAAEIEAIRGVSSDSSIRALLDRRLIAELGRKPTPGRPNLYGTSDEFLHQFKLHSIEELPPLDLPILGEGVASASDSETVESPSVP
jgi:segregation and condensation protein B